MKSQTIHEEFCLKNAAHFGAARGRTPATRAREQFATLSSQARADLGNTSRQSRCSAASSSISQKPPTTWQLRGGNRKWQPRGGNPEKTFHTGEVLRFCLPHTAKGWVEPKAGGIAWARLESVLSVLSVLSDNH